MQNFPLDKPVETPMTTEGWRFALACRAWRDFLARGGKAARYPWRLYVLPTAETVLSEGDLACCHVFTYLKRGDRVIFEGKDIE